MCVFWGYLSISTTLLLSWQSIGFRDFRQVEHWKYNGCIQNHNSVFAKQIQFFQKEYIYCRSWEVGIQYNGYQSPPGLLWSHLPYVSSGKALSGYTKYGWGKSSPFRKIHLPRWKTPITILSYQIKFAFVLWCFNTETFILWPLWFLVSFELFRTNM